VAPPLEPLYDAADDAPEELVVARVPVDLLAPNSSRPDVVEAAGNLESWGARHLTSLGSGLHQDAYPWHFRRDFGASGEHVRGQTPAVAGTDTAGGEPRPSGFAS
jgi:hypothetical protein